MRTCFPCSNQSSKFLWPVHSLFKGCFLKVSCISTLFVHLNSKCLMDHEINKSAIGYLLLKYLASVTHLMFSIHNTQIFSPKAKKSAVMVYGIIEYLNSWFPFADIPCPCAKFLFSNTKYADFFAEGEKICGNGFYYSPKINITLHNCFFF